MIHIVLAVLSRHAMTARHLPMGAVMPMGELFLLKSTSAPCSCGHATWSIYSLMHCRGAFAMFVLVCCCQSVGALQPVFLSKRSA
eukprot:3438405-Amphidinium_carterae.1